ncbi:hypothetical protein AOQ84DRAFT_420650 [Glonium stellatum]|uniref:Uncharacterized protein n=1 Tax=Glonium stellatum TaxID=574774 RepID=A0A8E2EQH8_9PEZI|nr:hypothetical protein AOQ84DRAFT_420650 [Glonium stellatum]
MANGIRRWPIPPSRDRNYIMACFPSTKMRKLARIAMDASADEIARVKAQFFRGIAQIDLTALNFDHPLARNYHRQPSSKKIARLKNIFTLENCLRSDEENFIDAIVDDDMLAEALQVSGLEANAFRHRPEGMEIPRLLISHVDCLNGLHRTCAAKRHLDQNDQWWTVRLFSKELSTAASKRIIEAFRNEQPFSDGEIFRKMRQYHQMGDKKTENQWLARLTPTKQKDLRQLLKDKRFAAAFDELVDMQGMWDPIKLGTLHRLLSLKCDEELLNYLKHVSVVWKQILRCGDSSIPMSAVDAISVQSLELCAPAISERDRLSITGLMRSKDLFPAITDSRQREHLLENILSIHCLIPSL